MAWSAWRQSLRSFLASPAMLSMTGGLVASGFYVVYKESTRYPRMMKTYAQGNILPPLAENNYEVEYFHRPEIEEEIRQILRPTFANEYFLVNGDVGVGKSRLVLEVVRELMTNEGSNGMGAPIYVLTNQGHSFPATLARAVNFYFDEHVNFKFFLDFVMRIHSMPGQDEKARLIRVLEAIENSAFDYMQKAGRPAVLVIDGVNYLPQVMPGALEMLQAKAKLWADSNAVKVVFINNDESTERMMQKCPSSWSRMGVPIVIEDLTKEEAIDFMMSEHFWETEPGTSPSGVRNQMPLETATKIVDLIGGRLHTLLTFKRDWLAGIPYDVTADDLIDREREKFIAVKTRSSANMWKVITLLRRAPGMQLPLSKLSKETSLTDVYDMARLNLIRYDRENGTVIVRFRSRLTERIIVDMVDFADC